MSATRSAGRWCPCGTARTSYRCGTGRHPIRRASTRSGSHSNASCRSRPSCRCVHLHRFWAPWGRRGLAVHFLLFFSRRSASVCCTLVSVDAVFGAEGVACRVDQDFLSTFPPFCFFCLVQYAENIHPLVPRSTAAWIVHPISLSSFRIQDN